MTVALRIDLMAMVLPAAAVPVKVKMPEPITAPTPRAVRLSGPKVRRSFFSGSSEAASSASMLFVRKRLTGNPSVVGERFDSGAAFEGGNYFAFGEADHGNSAIAMIGDQGGFAVRRNGEAHGIFADGDDNLFAVRVLDVDDVDCAAEAADKELGT